MTTLLSRLRKNPAGLLKRAFQKLITARLRYGRGPGYDARAYWTDRLTEHAASLRGPGHEGLSEQDNAAMYDEAAVRFRDTCLMERVNLRQAEVLEIGCGNGYYTRLCHKLGVTRYTALDITDAMFPLLQGEFPGFVFRRLDISRDRFEGAFDLVLMIDVAEHIVEDERLDVAAMNIKNCLAADGLVIVALPLRARSMRSLFYLRFWTLQDIVTRFPGYLVSNPLPFRDGSIITIRKAADSTGAP